LEVKKMKDNESAFPVRGRWDSTQESFDLVSPGMTAKQYAAIHLKVPRSGDEGIDGMIRESRRADFAGLVLAEAVSVDFAWNPKSVSETIFLFVDALLAEWEKEAKSK
jgi:hypothetical protein